MALFSINRYSGEDDQFTASGGVHGNQAAHEILARLHRDAKVRQKTLRWSGRSQARQLKQHRSPTTVHTGVDKTIKGKGSETEGAQVSSKGLKKRKKKIERNAANESSALSSSDRAALLMSPKSKKRKQAGHDDKKEGTSGSETNIKKAEEGVSTLGVNSQGSGKKKSKRKELIAVTQSSNKSVVCLSSSKSTCESKEVKNHSDIVSVSAEETSSELLVTGNNSAKVEVRKRKIEQTGSVAGKKRKKKAKQAEEIAGSGTEDSQTGVKGPARVKKKPRSEEDAIKNEVKQIEEATSDIRKFEKEKTGSGEKSCKDDSGAGRKEQKEVKSEEVQNVADGTEDNVEAPVMADRDEVTQENPAVENVTKKPPQQAVQLKGGKTPNKDSKSQKKGENEETAFQILGEVQRNRTGKVYRKLPDWLANPSVVESDIQSNLSPTAAMLCIGEFLQQKLRENGVKTLFPVQQQVIPAVLADAQDGTFAGTAGFRPSDICVSAPTGSGKTLAFVIPVVQALLQRVVPAVRALVVLPTKDLAVQVCRVFNLYTSGSSLRVANCTGQRSLAVERHALVKESRDGGYQSLADIVVATPGRLVDHLEKTAGFSLKQLRFLVIDEADRMLDKVKQDWLSKVTRAVYEGQGSGDRSGLPTILWAGALGERTAPGPLTAAGAARMQQPLQKLLFSATLSQNPEKLQQLSLFHPRLFTSVVRHRDRMQGTAPAAVVRHQQGTQETAPTEGSFVGKFTTPAGLQEYTVRCKAADKPLVLLYFLLTQQFQHVLCFTGSLESTHRLYLLAKLYGGVKVAEFSSNLPPDRRTKILNRFRTGKIQLVVCSDAMARGMDVEGVEVVISYDVPPYVKTYIHRVGRTARAGREGRAFSLVLQEEEKPFLRMVRRAGKAEPRPWPVTSADLQPLVPRYQKTLQRLQRKLQVEAKTK